MGLPLQELVDNIARKAGMLTRAEAFQQGVCVKCRKPPTFYSDAGRREYGISGLCEPCFDRICGEEE